MIITGQVLHAFDPDTGVLIAQIAPPGNASGARMTYLVNGKQFIVLPRGGAGRPAETGGTAFAVRDLEVLVTMGASAGKDAWNQYCSVKMVRHQG